MSYVNRFAGKIPAPSYSWQYFLKSSLHPFAGFVHFLLDLSSRNIKVFQYSESQQTQSRAEYKGWEAQSLTLGGKNNSCHFFFSSQSGLKTFVVSPFSFLDFFSPLDAHQSRTTAERLSLQRHKKRKEKPLPFWLLSVLFPANAVKISCPTCLGVTGPMLVAVARHTRWQRPFAGVLPRESRRALLAKLTGKTRRAGAQFHPRGGDRPGRTGGDGSGGQGHTCKLGCIWEEARNTHT